MMQPDSSLHSQTRLLLFERLINVFTAHTIINSSFHTRHVSQTVLRIAIVQ